MRRLIVCTAPLVLALAACGSGPAEEEVVTEEAVVEEAPAMVTANGSPAGTYLVTYSDGSTALATIGPDGSYSETDMDGAVTAEGSVAVVDGKTCFTPTTEGEMPMCWAESAPAEDGSFTATPDEGDPATVAPYVAEEPAA